jgi:hypothetical protein
MSPALRVVAVSAGLLALVACFDFEKAYDDCYASGNCNSRPPPQILSTEPEARATDVDPGTFVAVEFDAPMNVSTVLGTLNPPVELTQPEWDDAGVRVTWTPVTLLAPSTQYTLTVAGLSAEGSTLPATEAVSFTTRAPPQGPTIAESTPKEGQQAVPLDAGFGVRFSRPLDTTTFGVQFDPVYLPGDPSWSAAGDEVVFPEAPAWKEDTAYTVTVSGKDQSGLDLTGDTAINFRTVGDVIAPVVVDVVPVAGSNNVPPNVAQSITFSEPMADVSLSAITVNPNTPACTWVLNAAKTTATCNHAALLTASTLYTFTVGTGARDRAVPPQSMAAPYAFSFTTGTTPDTTPPTILNTNPPDAGIGASRSGAYVIAFSEPMDPAATQTAVKFSAPAGTTATSFSWSDGGTVLRFYPSPTLVHGQNVNWQVDSTAKDLAGVTMASTRLYTFRTIRKTSTRLYSEPTLDGYVYSDSKVYTSASTNYVGDIYSNERMRSFFSFNLSGLVSAGATSILSSDFNVYQSTAIGKPYTALSTLLGEAVAYGSTLEASDYSLAPNKVRGFCPKFIISCEVDSFDLPNQTNTQGLRTVTVTNWVSSFYAGTSSPRRAQFRLRFTKTTNSDSISDYVGFSAGESGTNPAYLDVEYEYP